MNKEQPIQKEEEYFDKQPEGDEKCRCGHIVKECYYNQISGEKHQRKEGEPLCSHCYNFSIPSDTFTKDKNFSDLTKEQQDKVLSECCEETNKEQAELVDSVFPSDIFIDQKMKEFDKKLLYLDYIPEGMKPELTLFAQTKQYQQAKDFLKSSLQSQRQSILEEIEKMKTDERKVYYFGKEPNCYGAETYQEKMLVNAVLEDIKQLLKDNKE